MIPLVDLVEAVRQRWRLALFGGLAVFALIAVIALAQPRYYSAVSSVLIDVSQSDPTQDEKSLSPQQIEAIVGTQADVIKSEAVLVEVARRAGLLARLSGLENDRRQQALAIIRSNLKVVTDRTSNVIRISYMDQKAEQSARIVNLVADVFMEKQVELRAEPARRNAQWFNERTVEVRQRYEKAQERLSNFQREHGIVGIDRMDLEGDRVKTLTDQLVIAQADAAKAHSVAGRGAVPEVAGSDIVQNLEREVASQSAKTQDLAKTLGPNHPQLIAAKANLRELQASLGQARGSQEGALKAASGAASAREARLRGLLSAQQARMIGLSTVQDQLMVLQRDVDAARQTYDSVRQRFNEASLQGEISQASATRLDHAAVPVFPAKPNLMLWLVAAVVLGVMAGIVPLLLLELARPRIRSARGAARATDVEHILDFTRPMGIEPTRIGGLAA